MCVCVCGGCSGGGLCVCVCVGGGVIDTSNCCFPLKYVGYTQVRY